MEVGGYDSPSASAACCLSAHQLQEGQSVFESGPLRSKPACVITPSREPACLVAVRREGEKCTKIFRTTRKITSLGTSPRRNPSVPRAGAHRNGLWDVKEARTSPLLPPESRRLDAPFSDFLRKILVYFAEKFGMYPTNSARNTDFFLIFAEKSGMNVRHVFAAFRSSNAAKSPFRDKK